MRITFEELQEAAITHGLTVVSVTSSDPLDADRSHLEKWQAQGFAGEMNYMLRGPEILSSPLRLMPECKTVIVFGIGYDSRAHPPLTSGKGRVARYAWGLDYHDVIGKLLKKIAAELCVRGGSTALLQSYTDAVPVLERALGARSGLGFVGKNTLLIRPREGSLFFLAEAFTNLEIDGAPQIARSGGCGSCVRCQTGCPTGALKSDYQLDARRCTSYLTIEKRGNFSLDERKMLGEWIFGCDICQEVCPFNHRAKKGQGMDCLADFAMERGVGPLLDLVSVLQIRKNREFQDRFGNTAIMRARRVGLVRNAAVVAANTKAVETAAALGDAMTEDSSVVVRKHCAWALSMLYPLLDGAQRKHARSRLEAVMLRGEPEIRSELTEFNY